MGIDVSGISTAPKKRWLLQRTRRTNPKALQTAALAWAKARELGPLFQMRTTSDGGLEIELLPVADPVQIGFDQDRLIVSFRSSNGGPGFHAAAIDLLDHIAAALSVTWCWVASDGTQLDETGYATERDYSALQTTMAEFLRSLCAAATSLTARASGASGEWASICTPLGLGHVPGRVALPLGFERADWPQDVANMDGAALEVEASGFFTWWDEGLTGTTWVQLLRAQLWQNAQWRPAVTEQDKLVCDQIRHSYTRAVAEKAQVPVKLEQAYRQYLQWQSESAPPNEDGIGYRKYLVWHRLYESWAMSLPGYLTAADNDGTLNFEHPAYWLGITSFASKTESGQSGPFVWPASYTGAVISIRPGLDVRKSQRKSEDDNFAQSALICSTRPGGDKILLLTLSSQLEWPFEAFDRWIMTVSCPDLIEPGNPRSSTLH